MDKDQKKQLRKEREEKDRQDILAKIPITRNDLADLFDYLDESQSDCEHTLAKTKAFLESRKIYDDSILKWLAQYGGHCDCEVLDNVEMFCCSLFKVDGDRLTKESS